MKNLAKSNTIRIFSFDQYLKLLFTIVIKALIQAEYLEHKIGVYYIQTLNDNPAGEFFSRLMLDLIFETKVFGSFLTT